MLHTIIFASEHTKNEKRALRQFRRRMVGCRSKFTTHISTIRIVRRCRFNNVNWERVFGGDEQTGFSRPHSDRMRINARERLKISQLKEKSAENNGVTNHHPIKQFTANGTRTKIGGEL